MAKRKPEAVLAPPSDPTTDYARAVVAGEIVAGKLVRLACERHLRDLGDAAERGLQFIAAEAARAFSFFGLLCHWKGRWAGKPFTLTPFQQFVIGSLFGWRRPDGTRRFRAAHIEIARKNGKTILGAGIMLACFVLDGEAGAECYTVATKKDQARISHEDAKQMARKSPGLRRRLIIYKDNLNFPETMSKFEPLGSDSDSTDGLNTHAWLADELHAWKDRKLFDVMETSTGARAQPLGVSITTAGYDRHSIWWERRELGIKVLEGVVDDDSLFAYIATLDEGDDWTDERNWIKGNPNLGVSLRVEDMRAECEAAKVTPGKQNPFKRLRLNVPTEQADRWLSLEQWNAGAGSTGWKDLREALKGRDCFAALDLSSTIDLAALVLLFPLDDGDYATLPFFWIPRETAQRRSDEDRISYPLWEEQGAIEFTEGNAVDQDFIRRRINELNADYHLREIAADRWNAAQIVTQLQGDGFEVVLFGQGFASMSGPAKEVERLVVEKKIAHGGHPVLRWCVANAACEQDAAGNIKPSKAKSTGRIDGVVGLTMCVGRATSQPAADVPTVSWM